MSTLTDTLPDAHPFGALDDVPDLAPASAAVPAAATAKATSGRTILCVDDEPNILSALQRLLRGSGHRILTAESGQAAIDILSKNKVDLLISDMRMPGMSGTELVRKVRGTWPDVTRLLLSGAGDINATISAINEGQVHRYLTKPWNDGELLLTIKEAFDLKQLEEDKRRLEALTTKQNEELKDLNANLEALVAERTVELEQAHDRLKRNYFNSIKTFSNLIELRGGQLMGHARHVADTALRIAKAMNMEDAAANDVLISALLHDIGLIGLPDYVFTKATSSLAPADITLYRQHPELGEQTLLSQDDMQAVATVIRSHHERFDGQGYPDGLAGDDIPLGSRILAVADAYEDLQSGHLVSGKLNPTDARVIIERGRGSLFDPQVVDAFASMFAPTITPNDQQAVLLRPEELEAGMIMARDFISPQGALLLAAEHVLTTDLIQRIRLFEKRNGRPVLLATKKPKESA